MDFIDQTVAHTEQLLSKPCHLKSWYSGREQFFKVNAQESVFWISGRYHNTQIHYYIVLEKKRPNFTMCDYFIRIEMEWGDFKKMKKIYFSLKQCIHTSYYHF